LFCAHPLSRKLLADAAARLGRPTDGYAIRASLGIGTTAEHVDRLLHGLREVVNTPRGR
jgi:selenocysteine lyase/cysteine desulfurase